MNVFHYQSSLFKESLFFILLCLIGFVFLFVFQSILFICFSEHNAPILLRSIQWAQTLFIMILPPIVYSKMRVKKSVLSDLYLSKIDGKMLWLSFFLIISALPFLEWFALICSQIPWPDYIVVWADHLSSQNEIVMNLLLSGDGVLNWIGLILLVSLATAFGEELMFRGAILNLLLHYVPNFSRVAWIIGFVFSAIHFDFYGFFPRLLLGVLFVYLVYWTGSLWCPILVHAVNNFVAILEYKLLPSSGLQVGFLSSPWLISFSLIVSIILIIVISRFKHRDNLKDNLRT